MLSFAYRCLTDLGAPVIRFYLHKRRAEGREDAVRFEERLGHPSLPRPAGFLIWCHAASVGEAASLLTLVEKLREMYPEKRVLMTTGTVTSARMLEGRLPPGVMHQYMPVDRMAYVRRFLNHWSPDFILWIESELWPNMLAEVRTRGIPAVLLNGRMSEASFRNWYRVKSWARSMLRAFVLTLTQTDEERSRFVALGARPVRCVGNLKYAANPLPVDDAVLADVKKSIGGRPVWLMASTHRGEEEMALTAHRQLRKKYPDVLTILVPRHASRGDEVAFVLGKQKVPLARRSKNEPLLPVTEIYLADTMGELGLFFRLSPVVCMGGSFAWGGHNPIEPAQLNCAIIFGPRMQNFASMAREFLLQQAALQIKNEHEIAFTVEYLLGDAAERMRYVQNARILADRKRSVLDDVMLALEPWLSTTKRRAA